MLDPKQAQPLSENLVRLTRVQNVVYPGLLASLSCYLLSGNVSTAILCYVFFVCVYAVATIHNNMVDVKTDIYNKRQDNPIANGEVSQTAAKVFLASNVATLALVQVWLEQPVSLIIAGLYLLLAYAYSNRHINVQSRGWLAPLLLTVCYGALPVMLGVSQGENPPAISLFWLALLQILLLSPILLAKDYKDLAGDRKTGKKTPLIRYGAKTVKRASYVLASSAIAICLLVFYWNIGGYLWLGLVAAIAYIAFVYRLHTAGGKIKVFPQKAGMFSVLSLSLLAVFAFF
jgi:4-hydroxybenzoate polyprenyltransferase